MTRQTYTRIVMIGIAACCGVGLATAVFADARAESDRQRRVVRVRSTAVGSIGDCDLTPPYRQNGGTRTSTCFRTGNAGANIGYASGTAGPGFAKRVAWSKGNASAGLGTSAFGDTAAFDSVEVTYANSTGQTTLTINGLIYANGTRSTSSSIHRVLLYADTVAANADVNSTGAGAIFNGSIQISASISKPVPVVTYSGDFSAGDFTVTDANNRVYIQANNLNKMVAVPDTAKVVLRGYSDVESSAPVPAISPVLMALLTLLLGGSAFYVLRRRGAAESA